MFESGLARLAPKQIEMLASRFERLEKGIGIEVLEFRPLNLLSEKEFLVIQQKMLADSKYNNLWFFGVRHLPVLRDAAYEEKWAENIGEKGICYNIVMVLDKLMDESKFERLQGIISRISRKVEEIGDDRHGKINILGVTIGKTKEKGFKNSELGRHCEYFNRLKLHFTNQFKDYVSINGPFSMAESKYEKCRAILHYGWLRSVVCYLGDRGINSFASVFLEYISNNPRCRDSGESGWTFLSPDATDILLVNIREFERHTVAVLQ